MRLSDQNLFIVCYCLWCYCILYTFSFVTILISADFSYLQHTAENKQLWNLPIKVEVDSVHLLATVIFQNTIYL